MIEWQNNKRANLSANNAKNLPEAINQYNY
jgi:hypothetical protein